MFAYERTNKLLNYYKYRFKGSCLLKKYAYKRLLKMGVDIPPTVEIGKGFLCPHPFSIVIHPDTIIDDNVRIYQDVTIGRADIYNDLPATDFKGFHICEGTIICSGAKILGTHGTRTIGENSVIAANAVVVEDVPKNTIVGGIPAKVIGRVEKR